MSTRTESSQRAAPRLRRLRLPYAATRSSFATSIRLGLLLLAAACEPLLGDRDPATLPLLAAVITLALLASGRPDGHPAKVPLLVGEGALTALGLVLTPVPALPLLVCLPSTTIAAGLAAGYRGAAATGGLTAVVLLLGGLLRAEEPGAAASSAATSQWALVALLSGVLAARIHSLSSQDGRQDPYAEAHRLLAQLRAVTRGLEGSLDPGTVAQTLMEQCMATSGAGYGAVLLHVGGDQLVPRAVHGYRRVPWRAQLSEDGPIARAWLSGAPVTDHRPRDTGDGGREGSTLLVLPILVEQSRVGVVALEWRPGDHDVADELPTLLTVVGRYALPLETAELFDELRIAAANEERSRLAREMHDGIAQDLAYLGYELDGLTTSLRRSGAEAGAEQARELRGRITTLISDLRLSISDLRSSVGPSRGLGAALSEYARSAGTSSGLRVQLSLKEGSTRLPADSEVQLLRIAHEAVARARRRPGARNLWVTLDVDPPSAMLRVEDDAPNSPESVGAERTADEGMDERARRLGARLRIERSVPTGTSISVWLGEEPS